MATTTRSRRGRFPDPRISLLIGRMEIRRFVRKVRGQDVWLALMVLGVLFVVVALPIVFGFGRDAGESIASDGAPGSFVELGFVVGWVAMVAFGLVSGVGSEGEVDNQEALLAIRPPKDVAGGLIVYVLWGYAPFVLAPAIAAALGIAVGTGEPLAIVGILLSVGCLVVTGVIAGYACGLFLKGVIRRSPWLSAAKPLLGAAVIVGYFWASFTGRLWPVLSDVGSALAGTPLGWFVDLALVTTPGVSVSVPAAVALLALSIAFVPVGVLSVVVASQYAWFVEREGDAGDALESDDAAAQHAPDEIRFNDESSAVDSRRITPPRVTLGDRLERTLNRVEFSRATSAIAVTVLRRGYRAPLQLVYVAVPLLFLIPMLDSIVRTGTAPSWFPWMVVLYGAWAAGAGFPLNVLGNQGSTLPRLLTSPATGRQIVHGYILATSIVFVPLTVALGVLTGTIADRSPVVLASIALASAVVVVAAAVVAAGIGSAFPRFSTIDLTDNTSAVLPSKLAFGAFSILALLAANSVAVLADESFRTVFAGMLTEYFPYAVTVTASDLELVATAIAVVVTLSIPVAYTVGATLIEQYQVS